VFDTSLLKKLDDDKYFKINFLGQNTGENIMAENNREKLLDLFRTDDKGKDTAVFFYLKE
jgi:hypothetical protein